ncbi:hypothetical protein THAOC_16990, partial [Thalassiosira oceanica]
MTHHGVTTALDSGIVPGPATVVSWVSQRDIYIYIYSYIYILYIYIYIYIITTYIT